MKKLLVFTAPWCGPCTTMYPIIQELTSELKGKIVVEKVSMDDNQDTAVKYGVRSIPAFVLLDSDDSFITIKVGSMPKDELSRFVSSE